MRECMCACAWSCVGVRMWVFVCGCSYVGVRVFVCVCMRGRVVESVSLIS